MWNVWSSQFLDIQIHILRCKVAMPIIKDADVRNKIANVKLTCNCEIQCPFLKKQSDCEIWSQVTSMRYQVTGARN